MKTPKDILDEVSEENLNNSVNDALTTKELIYKAIKIYANQFQQNDNFQNLIDDIGKWSDEKFGLFNREIPLTNKLSDEVKELLDALKIYKQSPNDVSLNNVNEEIVDCLMILVDIARMVGLSSKSLIKIGNDKLQINKNRT